MKIKFSALLLLSLSNLVSAQDRDHPERRQVFMVPNEIYLQVIVAQPECPLRIEKAALLAHLNGTYEKVYVIHNIGNKPVKSYRIAIWNSDNTGDVTGWHVGEGRNKLLMPGEKVSEGGNILEDAKPITDEIRSRLKLKPTMKRIVFFMIIEAEFSDGSKYDAKSLFESLEKHLEKFEFIYEKKIDP